MLATIDATTTATDAAWDCLLDDYAVREKIANRVVCPIYDVTRPGRSWRRLMTARVAAGLRATCGADFPDGVDWTAIAAEFVDDFEFAEVWEMG